MHALYELQVVQQR